MHSILIVEDDFVIRTALTKELSKWGYDVHGVDEFDQVLTEFIRLNPQLVILDITLPFFNGYYWCQEIRKLSKVPILFLSSRDQAMDIVMSINMGADDFITKPFDMTILVAKIQGLIRRSYEFMGNQDWIDFKGVTLHLKSTHLTYQGQTVDLTKNEFQILRILFEHMETYVSRDDLMKGLWNSNLFIDDNTLTVNVARLRKKLEDVGLKDFISTKKGIGYGLVSAL
ncbi:response regulator transcription factor [Granulicatella seriolae]|uniref:Response regulator transcription factor n=1 Tax=Granulicatella seriolae TaxID=2967226 RepID=A0ABT1WNM4_9LACT|nr:response regulator transcription factor [Granulicatella seriolae]